MPGKWYSMSEFARRNGIARQSVMQAVRAGRVETNGKSGRECRVRGKLAEPERGVRLNRAGSELSDLSAAKLEKLKADTKLQTQRLKENREAEWRQFAEAVSEEYLQAFSPLTARLTEMRLPAQKLSALRKIIDDCTKSFMDALKKRWQEYESEDV